MRLSYFTTYKFTYSFFKLNGSCFYFNNCNLINQFSYGADVSSDGLTNSTAIGNGAKVSVSNAVQIGNAAVTDAYFGNGTVIIHANSIMTPSDGRFKYNIGNNVPGLNFINKLRPVTYYLDQKKLTDFAEGHAGIDNVSKKSIKPEGKKLLTGFIAQEVEKAAKDIGYHFNGVHEPVDEFDHYSLDYTQFVMPLVTSIHEQQKMIEYLTQQLKIQADHIKQMSKEIKSLTELKRGNKKNF